MRLTNALSSYLLQLEADGRSVHTVGQYRRHIRALSAWLGPDRDLDSITTSDLARYMVAPETTADRSSATLNAVRTSLRTFFAYLHAAGFSRSNPARLLRLALRTPAPPRGFSAAEIDRLNATLARATGACARRDQILLATMLLAGLRLGSALALDCDDVDLERRELVVRVAKRDQAERVMICRELADRLRVYLVGRRGALFSTCEGARLGKRQAQRRIEIWLRKAGIDHGSAHSCRHAFALDLYRRTGQVLLVQRALRHRSIASTMTYARASDDALRTALG